MLFLPTVQDHYVREATASLLELAFEHAPPAVLAQQDQSLSWRMQLEGTTYVVTFEDSNPAGRRPGRLVLDLSNRDRMRWQAIGASLHDAPNGMVMTLPAWYPAKGYQSKEPSVTC